MLEIIITGHVGSLRFVQAGTTQVLNLSVASSRRFQDREFTTWVNAKVWGARAVSLQPYIQTGARLLLRGRPEARGFRRGDGTVGAEIILHVHSLEFLSPRAKPAADDLTGENKPPPITAKPPRRKTKA